MPQPATAPLISNPRGGVVFQAAGGHPYVQWRVDGGGQSTDLDLPYSDLADVFSVEGPVNDFEPSGGTLIDSTNKVVKVTAPAGLAIGQSAYFRLNGSSRVS